MSRPLADAIERPPDARLLASTPTHIYANSTHQRPLIMLVLPSSSQSGASGLACIATSSMLSALRLSDSTHKYTTFHSTRVLIAPPSPHTQLNKPPAWTQWVRAGSLAPVHDGAHLAPPHLYLTQRWTHTYPHPFISRAAPAAVNLPSTAEVSILQQPAAPQKGASCCSSLPASADLPTCSCHAPTEAVDPRCVASDVWAQVRWPVSTRPQTTGRPTLRILKHQLLYILHIPRGKPRSLTYTLIVQHFAQSPPPADSPGRVSV
jgi:hypothetical protein